MIIGNKYTIGLVGGITFDAIYTGIDSRNNKFIFYNRYCKRTKGYFYSSIDYECNISDVESITPIKDVDVIVGKRYDITMVNDINCCYYDRKVVKVESLTIELEDVDGDVLLVALSDIKEVKLRQHIVNLSTLSDGDKFKFISKDTVFTKLSTNNVSHHFSSLEIPYCDDKNLYRGFSNTQVIRMEE